MDTGGAHPVTEIYNPGSEISLQSEMFCCFSSRGLSDTRELLKKKKTTENKDKNDI